LESGSRRIDEYTRNVPESDEVFGSLLEAKNSLSKLAILIESNQTQLLINSIPQTLIKINGLIESLSLNSMSEQLESLANHLKTISGVGKELHDGFNEIKEVVVGMELQSLPRLLVDVTNISAYIVGTLNTPDLYDSSLSKISLKIEQEFHLSETLSRLSTLSTKSITLLEEINQLEYTVKINTLLVDLNQTLYNMHSEGIKFRM
jgi:hypothetical protein